jgi:hypothetical protein
MIPIMTENNAGITDGIDTLIIKCIDKAIANNSQETFVVLKTFVRNILQESIQGKSVGCFMKYIYSPAAMYHLAYSKQKISVSLSMLYRTISEEAALMLKEVIWLDIGIPMKDAKSQEERKSLNYFYYHSFSGFSRYLYHTISNRDFQQFKFAANEIRQLSNPLNNNNYNLKSQIRQLESESDNVNVIAKIASLKETADVTGRFDIYKRHVITGLRSWLFYLYDKEKIDWKGASLFLERLQIDPTVSEEYIRDILFFRSNRAIHFYLDWGSWDLMERETWKFYTAPNPTDWLTMGFLIDQIQENRLYLSLEDMSDEESQIAEFLHLDLVRCIAKLREGFDKWKDVLKTETIEIFTEKTDQILSVFANLKRKGLSAREIAIAKAPLSKSLIESFRSVIGNAWKSQARIHNMFRLFKNTEHVPSDGPKLKIVGQKTFFEKTKMMFIEGEFYQVIYGIDRMGWEIGRWEDDVFFNKILEGEYSKLVGKSVLEILDKGITVFNKKEVTPTLILLSPEISYQDDELLNSNRFKLKTNMDEGEEKQFFLLGSFDGIPIYSSFSTMLDNKVVLCDFAAAFNMKYKADEAWFENELKVDVNEVTDEYARQKLNSNPAKWKTNSEGLELSNEEAITLIKTSVMIDIWTTLDFEVKNKELYIVGFINK